MCSMQCLILAIVLLSTAVITKSIDYDGPHTYLSEDAFNRDLLEIASTERFTQPNKTRAYQYIAGQFLEMGLTTELHINNRSRLNDSLPRQRNRYVEGQLPASVHVLAKIVPVSSTRANLPVYVLVGHYDTVPDTQGLFDNAAGVAVVMNAARAISSMIKAQTRNGTVEMNAELWFLATDNEEDIGPILGSYDFLYNLGPDERSRIQGAWNVDSIGQWSDEAWTQTFPSGALLAFLKTSLRNISTSTAKSLTHFHRGNFVTLLSDAASTSLIDKTLSTASKYDFASELSTSPISSPAHRNKTYLLPVSTGLYYSDQCNILGGNLCRSEQLAFLDYQIPIIQVTDTANFRTMKPKQASCYHQNCDNFDLLNPGSLRQLTQIQRILSETLWESARTSLGNNTSSDGQMSLSKQTTFLVIFKDGRLISKRDWKEILSASSVINESTNLHDGKLIINNNNKQPKDGETSKSDAFSIVSNGGPFLMTTAMTIATSILMIALSQ